MRPGPAECAAPAPLYELPLVLLIKGSPGDKRWPAVTMQGTGAALQLMCLLGSCPHCALCHHLYSCHIHATVAMPLAYPLLRGRGIFYLSRELMPV